jgi:hypothetical protein
VFFYYSYCLLLLNAYDACYSLMLGDVEIELQDGTLSYGDDLISSAFAMRRGECCRGEI